MVVLDTTPRGARVTTPEGAVLCAATPCAVTVRAGAVFAGCLLAAALGAQDAAPAAKEAQSRSLLIAMFTSKRVPWFTRAAAQAAAPGQVVQAERGLLQPQSFQP
jgi:hypothetical protein